MPDLSSSEPDRLALGDTLRQLHRELHKDLALLRSTPQLLLLEARGAELERYLTDLDAQLQRHGTAAVITLVGSTGAGKSTLLNALVGQDVAVAGTTRPTTSRPVIYKPRNVDIGQLVEGLGPVEVREFDPNASGGPFTEQVLIDAPDTNSVATEHRAVVEKLSERSDALVIVAHRQSVAELASVSFVDLFAGRRDLCFVLNRADELTEASTEELRSQLQELAAARWKAPDAPVITTSALEASAGRPDAGFGKLMTYLTGLVESGRLGGVRRDNALGTCARIATLAREVDGALQRVGSGGGLAGLSTATHAAVGRFRERVEAELDVRLEVRQKDIELLLWNETARRWQGPGGWALRAGGLSGLGIGAGAALARRNPLVAAGAAVGGLALDRAQSGLRERRIERASGLVPTDHELQAWYRESFVPPRILAQELSGSAEAFGMPRADEVGQEATAAIESAWSQLVERELPKAGARGARPWVRLLVDLPVFVLGAWLVVQAAVGVLPIGWTEGLASKGLAPEALTSDRLINAAIVLGAWLFLGRSFVRAGLARLARGLTAGVRQEAARNLGEPGGIETTTTAALDHELELRRGALRRLGELDDLWRARLHRSRPNPPA